MNEEAVILREIPYFMENNDWYETPLESSESSWFPDGRGYHIKGSAPKKAKKSYEEYYRRDSVDIILNE